MSDASSRLRLVVGDSEHRFDSEQVKHAWIAVHFLSTIRSEDSRAIIQEYSGGAAMLAGVVHVFVSAEPAGSFQEGVAALPNAGKQIVYRDADNQLASQLAIATPVANPQLVVLDVARKERLRHIGKSPSDCLPFTVFAKRVTDASQDNEAREANVSSRLAIEGYDPVAYVDEQKAIPGSQKLESSFKGIMYRFATAANRDRFNADPVKYVPAYGGWCATAMAKGEKVEIDPKNFKITNGRLFLFYKGLFGNALNDWNKDEPGQTSKADSYWKRIVAE